MNHFSTSSEQLPRPGYIECYVAFLDILGMSHLVRSGEEAEESVLGIANALRDLALLRSCAAANGPVNPGNAASGHLWTTQIRAFSDNVVLFVPTVSHRLNDLIQHVGYLYDRLLLQGYCLRGAITLGKMYWDPLWSPTLDQPPSPKGRSLAIEAPPITFGPGLVEAYELESKTALYPRIVIGERLMQHLRMRTIHPLCAGAHFIVHGTHVPFNDLFTYGDMLAFARTDFDQIPHLDIFNPKVARVAYHVIDEPPEEAVFDLRTFAHVDYMRGIRVQLEALIQQSTSDSVRAKQLWLANYFNVSLLAEYQLDPIGIPLDLRSA